MRPRFLLSTALAALLLTACQPSAAPGGSPSAAESSAAGGSGGPSFIGNPDLEATLPEEAAGIIFFQSVSMSGPDFVSAEVAEQFVAFIDQLGADIDDVSVAFTLGANFDGTKTASVFAFQVNGADSQQLVDAFKASAEEGGEGLVWNPQTVGGKAVEVAEPTPDFPTPVALYATGDVLYFVSSSDPTAFEAILSGLP
jgi:hypothetical protein